MARRITGEMNGHKIIVEVDGDKSVVTVGGVQGSGCKAITEAIERGLGLVVSSDPTPEMYQQNVNGISIG